MEKKQRIAAFDISKRRIGIAFSDEDCNFVAYSKTIFISNQGDAEKKLKILFQEYKPSLSFIGLPSARNDYFIKNFTHNLRHIFTPYRFVNEDFSTAEAKYIIQGASMVNSYDAIDSLVARSILMSQIL